MKRLIAAAVLAGTGSLAHAVAPGGPDCGWGNMLFEGQSGIVPHFLAGTTNGSSGNGTFGMTLETNGCSTQGTLTYGGDAMVWFDQVIEEYSTDVARGEGDALEAVAVMIGVAPEHRDHFGAVMHENFAVLFPSVDVTPAEVLDSMALVMREDATLSAYVVG